mgnify:CR=1 FL=1
MAIGGVEISSPELLVSYLNGITRSIPNVFIRESTHANVQSCPYKEKRELRI